MGPGIECPLENKNSKVVYNKVFLFHPRGRCLETLKMPQNYSYITQKFDSKSANVKMVGLTPRLIAYDDSKIKLYFLVVLYTGWSKNCTPSRWKLRNVLEPIWQEWLKLHLITKIVVILECNFSFAIATLVKNVDDYTEQFGQLLRSYLHRLATMVYWRWTYKVLRTAWMGKIWSRICCEFALLLTSLSC